MYEPKSEVELSKSDFYYPDKYPTEVYTKCKNGENKIKNFYLVKRAPQLKKAGIDVNTSQRYFTSIGRNTTVHESLPSNEFDHLPLQCIFFVYRKPYNTVLWWLESQFLMTQFESLELYDLTRFEFCLKGLIGHDSFPLRDSILENCRKMFSLEAKQMKCFAAVSNVERNIVCVLRISIRGRVTRSSDWGTSELANNVIVIARLGEGLHESCTAWFPYRIHMQLINRTLRCSRFLTNMTSV